jgi:hypothetical protein
LPDRREAAFRSIGHFPQVRAGVPLTRSAESSLPDRLAPQEQHRYEQANGEFRQSGFLRGVNQDENFGDAVFSDGPLDWETQGKIAVEWLPNNAVFQLVLHLEVTENTDPIWIGSS